MVTCGLAGCAEFLAVAIGEGGLEARPVDPVRQLHERVVGIEDLVEVGLEQLERGGVLGLGLHESVHICKVLTNRP